VSILGEPKRHLVGGVVLEHIEDEALLDRLPHRKHMEGRWQVAGAGGLVEIGQPAESSSVLALGVAV
jgi:hypothetical protein